MSLWLFDAPATLRFGTALLLLSSLSRSADAQPAAGAAGNPSTSEPAAVAPTEATDSTESEPATTTQDAVPSESSAALDPNAQAAQPTPPACTPACRAGFGCQAGQCVPLCSPPCNPGYRCSAGGVCEVTEPAVPEAPPPKVAPKTGVHQHDGFYLRFGFAFAYIHDTVDYPLGELGVSSAGGFLDLAIGGTVAQGLVVGFGLHGAALFSPKFRSDDASVKPELGYIEARDSATISLPGLYVDYYPDDSGGLHFNGTLGFGLVAISTVSDPNAPDSDEALIAGLGLAAGAGYDLWFGNQWSFGAQARLMYLAGAEDEWGAHNALVPMVSLGILFH